ncbi:MAG TPA: aspartate carbamoyltransferase [Noviherbaspirillum sp.]|uniref:aspartate carbamoyltransferase n=1 Tax=Noviherbaspirillum sp. TaxID=1926288 RepID=UPI002B4A8B7D|nr:aspartate carbamoyltransferase [Noviherbaspirillum sp.]HJV85210.1 aspartate carbamoyltransferase [Noviherbaspirillum sp.]
MKAMLFVLGLGAAAASFVQDASGAATQRQMDVATRGADVMPFDLAATTHVFTKTDFGGIQRVVTKAGGDTAQIELVRQHLQDIQASFQKGDFSGPSHIHGEDMPGLATLRAAKPGQLTISYSKVKNGAELQYRAHSPELVAALHTWFDAQLADHGHDAMAGHAHHHHQ